VRSWTWIALGVASLALASPSRAQSESAPAQQQAAPAGSERDASAETPEWSWPGSVVWDLELRLAFPPETGFDRALFAHGYGAFRIIPALAMGVAVPVVPWLWLGGQLGVRGRTWNHPERTHASLVGVDALATVRARIRVGSRVELGAVVGGGLGWIGTWVNGVLADQLAPRSNAQADVMFGIGRHFALGPSFGWDYFQTPSPINTYGHGVDAGGFYFGLSLEGRE